MNAGDLAILLMRLPSSAEVKMKSGLSCSIVRSVDYEFDGERDWVLLTDYPGTINSKSAGNLRDFEPRPQTP